MVPSNSSRDLALCEKARECGLLCPFGPMTKSLRALQELPKSAPRGLAKEDTKMIRGLE